MAQKVMVELLDDLDGTQAAETIKFALDGVTYEIDLSEDNAAELRDSLAQYVEYARRSGGRKSPRRAATSPQTREQSREIRAWARAQGYEVSDRGRLSAEIVDAYQAQSNGASNKGKPAKSAKKK